MVNPEVTTKRSRALLLALITHPSVQLVRFATKALLAWFVSPGEFGELMLAGLVFWVFFQIAWWGLDEALIWTERLPRSLWERLSGAQKRIALAASGFMALLAVPFALDPRGRSFGLCVLALAPTVFVSARSVLPMARLVRARAYGNLFRVEVGAAVVTSLTTVGLALTGVGVWAWIAANAVGALFTLGLATARQRELPFDAEQDGDPDADPCLRFGRRVTQAGLLSFAGNRADGFVIPSFLGAATFGVYELAHSCATFLLGYTTHVAERCLLPTLSREARGEAFARAMTLALLVFVPLHLVLVAAAEVLGRVLFPPHFPDPTPLLQGLALLSALRCLETVLDTSLKARGLTVSLLLLSRLRLGLIALALAWGVFQQSVVQVVLALLCARGIALGLAFLRTRDLLAAVGVRRLCGDLLWSAAWAAAFFGGSALLLDRYGPEPFQLTLLPALAALLWVLGRALLGRGALRQTLSTLASACLPVSTGESMRS